MRKLFYLLLALPLAMVACNTPEGEQDIVTLGVTSDKVVAFAAEGGEGVITYTLNVEALPEVTTEAEWITIGSVAEDIAYSVAPNVEYAERSAVITVSYNDLKADVTVNQAAAQSEDWTIVGSMTNNWDLNSAITMVYEEGFYAVKGVELTANDVFLFVKGDYDEVYGSNGTKLAADYFYNAVAKGSNIRVNEDGVYDLYLNEQLSKFYIMSEGKDPSEAMDSNKPVVVEWFVQAGETEYKMTKKDKYLVAQNVLLSEEGLFSMYNSKGVVLGAEGVFELNSVIHVAEGVEGIVVATEAEKEYDVYLLEDENSVWVVEDGQTPVEVVEWTSVEGFFYNNKNFIIAFLSDKLKFYFDVNCAISAPDHIIPEGVYYVQHNDEDGGNYFNLEEWAINDAGLKSYLLDGYMEIKHISGGYDIVFSVRSMHLKEYNLSYSGPVSGVAYMGNPVQNPQ